MNLTKNISIIGAPYDWGANISGSCMGPQALRVANLQKSISRYGQEVQDIGDINIDNNLKSLYHPDLKNFSQVVSCNNMIYSNVLEQLQKGKMPILLGGDHSLSIGSITAVKDYCQSVDKKLICLWFDSHADFNQAKTTTSGNVHGMAVSCLFGLGPDELTKIGRAFPVLNKNEIFQIGLRSLDLIEKKDISAANLAVYDMRYIDEIGMRNVMEHVCSMIDTNTHLHLSIDVDFLDPDIAPGVSTAVRGGPTYREAQLCMEMVADCGMLGSIDLMELNPAKDIGNKTAELLVDLMESLFGKSTLERVSSK